MSLWRELKRRKVVRVAAVYAVTGWLLIEVADTVFPRLMLPEWSVTLVIALLLIGFPVALVLSWAFELTPEGVKRAEDVDPAPSVPPLTGRKLDFVIIGVLVLVVAYFLVDRFVLVPQQQAEQTTAAAEAGQADPGAPEDNSIAVLAFDDMSPNGDQEYLSDGIAEELLNLLAQIPELRVISRSSSFSYKGKDVRLGEIAEALDVTHILEGSVRKAGDRVRITAQLIDARGDRHVWSESYDRTLEDIFAIQDEIASEVVGQLRVTLLGTAPQVRETDPEAYELYLQARDLGRLQTAASFEQSSDLYRQVLDIDPNHADAWAGLGQNAVNQVNWGLLPPDEGYALAREALERALAIDPEHARAHSRLGFIAMRGENDLREAARRMERALALAPADVAVISNASGLLGELGRLDQAISLLEYVVDRDPVSPASHYNLGFGRYYAARWDEAIAPIRESLQLSPGSRSRHGVIGAVRIMQGRPRDALEAFRQEPDERDRLRGLALAALDLGRMDEYRTRLDEFTGRWGEELPSRVAMLHAHAGNTDPAFEWLDRAVEQDEPGVGFTLLDPLFAPIHDDPRWHETLERIGRTPEQLAAIEFEVTRPEDKRD